MQKSPPTVFRTFQPSFQVQVVERSFFSCPFDILKFVSQRETLSQNTILGKREKNSLIRDSPLRDKRKKRKKNLSRPLFPSKIPPHEKKLRRKE